MRIACLSCSSTFLQNDLIIEQRYPAYKLPMWTCITWKLDTCWNSQHAGSSLYILANTYILIYRWYAFYRGSVGVSRQCWVGFKVKFNQLTGKYEYVHPRRPSRVRTKNSQKKCVMSDAQYHAIFHALYSVVEHNNYHDLV